MINAAPDTEYANRASHKAISLLASARSDRRLMLFAGGLLFVFTLFLFAPTFSHPFAPFDDPTNVSDNPFLRPVTAQTLPRFWSGPYYALYMPLTYTLWTGCALLAGGAGGGPLRPAPFHAASVLLHGANVLLAFAILRSLVRRCQPDTAPALATIAAGLGAALFAVHPLQVEAVSWVTGANNLTAGFFGLAALFFHFQASEAKGQNTVRLRVAALVLFLCALLSKPTAAALPLVALFVDTAVLRLTLRRALTPLVPWFALTLACLLLTQSTAREGNRGVYLPLWGRPFVVGDACAFYLAKLLVPQSMCIDYGRSTPTVLASWQGYFAGLVPLALVTLLVRLRQRTLLWGLGWALLAALPMLGLVPFYYQKISSVSDRYLYLALVGIGLSLALTLTQIRPDRRRIAFMLAGGWVVLLASVNVVQQSYWRDDAAFANHILTINPGSTAGNNGLGLVYAQARRPDLSNAYFERTVARDSRNRDALYNLGSNWDDLGDPKKAIAYLQRCLDADPQFTQAYNNLAIAYIHAHKFSQALSTLEAGLRVAPDNIPLRTNRDRLRKQLSAAPPP